MPYYRKKSGMSTSRFNKKKSSYSKRKNISPYLKKYVKSAIQRSTHMEMKHVNHIGDESAFLTSVGQYTVANLYQLSQGTASTQRVGLKVSPKGVSIRGNLSYNATTNTTAAYVRLVLIESPGSEVIVPLTSEIFKDTATNGSWGALTTSQMPVIWTPLNNQGYKIHWEQVYKLNPISTDGTYSKLVKKWVPLKGDITYDANSTGAGNQSRNFALLMLLAEGAQDTVGQTVEFSYLVRTYFTDA